MLGKEESRRVKGHVRVGTWERQSDKRRKRCKRDKRRKGKLCPADAFKGCTWRVADGGKAPGDAVTALETDSGCCCSRN